MSAGIETDAPSGRQGAMLAPSSDLSWLALTTDQATILYRLVHEHRGDITKRWSYGIWDGLSQALSDIKTAGGAYIRPLPPPTTGIRGTGSSVGRPPRLRYFRPCHSIE
jgi:hypothetical protein